jgi:hypothetical protein
VTRALAIDAIGTIIRIDGSALTDDAWAATQEVWADALAARSAATPAETVTAHGAIPVESMLASLSINVTLAALRCRAGEVLMLHAAGLATADGRVVVLVGPSGRGKTTVSRILGREFGYVSDESIAITAGGAVLPYRKPLSVIENDGSIKAQRSSHELGLLPLPDAPLRLAALVLLDRDDVTHVPSIEQVDLAEGIARLAEQASYLGRLPEPLGTIAGHVDAVGGIHRLRYSDASTLAPSIRKLASVGPTPREQASGFVRGPTGSPSSEPRTHALPAADSATAPFYLRCPALDALPLEDGRVVLLVTHPSSETRVLVLDGIAPTLWRATARPASMAELVDAALARHGSASGLDPATVVTARLEELTSQGVISRCTSGH